MFSKERRKKPREALSPFGELGLAHGSAAAQPAEKAIASGRPRIGLYCEGGDWIFFSPYFGRIFSGIIQSAEKAKSRLVLYLPDAGRGKGYSRASRHELGFEGVEQLNDGLLQGAIVICGQAPAPSQIKVLKNLNIPLVLLSNNIKVPGFFQLLSGAYERSYLCAEQLYIEGRKKVGLIGLYSNTTYHKMCSKALKDASKKAKRAFDPGQVQALNQWDLTKPYELQIALDKLLKLGSDAIICSEAAQAIVALELLQKQKVKMPKQVCLISFGPLPRSARIAGGGALRLLQVDLAEEGRRAFALLQEAMKGAAPRSETIRWSWPGY